MSEFPTVVALPAAPAGLAGTLAVPPSKSLTQRALVAAALAGRGAIVRNVLDAEDPRLLAAALDASGWRLSWQGGQAVAGGFAQVQGAEVFLGNNGTGVRFLLAQLAATPGRFRLDGTARLRERPVGGLLAALRALGADLNGAGETGERLPVNVRGIKLAGGAVTLDASASSQFVSALLLLGVRLPNGLAISLAATPPSRPYLDLTADVLGAFGACVTASGDGRFWRVAPGTLRPVEYVVEGDWSAAAFPLAGAAVAGGEVTVTGLRPDSRQGDAVVLAHLVAAGCRVHWQRDAVTLAGPACRPLVADLRDAPDLFPALAVVVARCGGSLTGLAGLAAKESDRLAVMTARLGALGFVVAAGGDHFDAPGGAPRATVTGALDPAADHRIAMALAVAGLMTGGRVADAECVGKSWPGFWRDWAKLTGARP